MDSEMNNLGNSQQQEAIDGASLLERALNHGDEAAFNEFYRRYFPVLRAYITRKTGDSNISEDIAQEAMTKLWKVYRNNYEDGGKGDTALLYSIATSCYINYFRREKRKICMDDEEIVYKIDHSAGSEVADPANLVITDEMSKIAVQTLVGPLSPERQHLVVAILDGEFASKTEYGETYDIPRGTVSTRLMRARADMRQILSELEGSNSIEELAHV